LGFAIQQLEEEEFTGRLLNVLHDKKDLAPVLKDRAVIRRQSMINRYDPHDLLDEEFPFYPIREPE